MTAAPTDAPPLGFWKIAETYPGSPRAGRPRRARGLRRRAAGVVQPARARPAGAGPERGDTSRCCCPTASRCSSCTSPSRRPASTSSRSTTTSSAPRSPTSSQRLRGQGVRRPRALRRRAPRPRPTRSASPRRAGSRSARHRRLPPVRRAEGRPADARARRPHGRARYELHVGHDRPPEGRAARARRTSTPTTMAIASAGSCCLFGVAAARRQRPHRRLAAVPHRRARVLGAARCTSATRSCSWTSGRPSEMLDLIEQVPASRTSHMVPTQFHRLLGAARGRAGASTTCRRCGTWCTPPRRARPTSSAG